MNLLNFLANAGTWASIGTIAGVIIGAATHTIPWSTAVTTVISQIPVLLAIWYGKATVASLRKSGMIND